MTAIILCRLHCVAVVAVVNIYCVPVVAAVNIYSVAVVAVVKSYCVAVVTASTIYCAWNPGVVIGNVPRWATCEIGHLVAIVSEHSTVWL